MQARQKGLYKTANAGADWTRLTGPDVIINDVYIDPKNDQRVMIASDRSGVLASDDGGKTFSSSNGGFSQRQVRTLLVDRKQPQTLYAGVLNDKIYGGVFVSRDNGSTWQQDSDGLAGRDVFTLAQSTDGSIYAGTNSGLVRLSNDKWLQAGDLVKRESHKVTRRIHGRRITKSVETVTKDGQITGRVNALDLDGPQWYAASVYGVYHSGDQGKTWERMSDNYADFRYMDAMDGRIVAGRRDSLIYSLDRGGNWKPLAFPPQLARVHAVTLSRDGAVWVGGREGLFYSKDNGASWQQIKNLPLGQIDGLSYDSTLKRVLVSSRTSTTLFGVDDSSDKWKFWEPGWHVNQVLEQNGRLVAASLFNGVVMEPQSENAGEAAKTQAMK